MTILLLASSGIRRGALTGLKKKHLERVEKLGFRLYKITTYPRAHEKYVTFCTPECAEAIDNYIECRRRSGETINDDSPVIRNAFNPHKPERVKNVKLVTKDAFKHMMVKIVKNSGLERRHEIDANGKVSQRTDRMLMHALRKFYDTNLSKARIQRDKSEILMGHGRRSLHRRYDIPDDENIMEEYVKAIPYLTINEESRLQARVATCVNHIFEILDDTSHTSLVYI